MAIRKIVTGSLRGTTGLGHRTAYKLADGDADGSFHEMLQNGATRGRAAHPDRWGYAPEPGMLYVAVRAISSRVNANYDAWPEEELGKSWRSFVGRGIFVEHENWDPGRARGVIIDAKLHPDTLRKKADHWVELLHEVDAQTYPRLANGIINGDVVATSMGADVEYTKCSMCGNEASDPREYCKHIPHMKGMQLRTASGKPQLVYESCYGHNFFEDSYVFDPADESALVADFYMAPAKTGSAPITGERLLLPVGSREHIDLRTASRTKTAGPDYRCPHCDAWFRDVPETDSNCSICGGILNKEEARRHAQETGDITGDPIDRPTRPPLTASSDDMCGSCGHARSAHGDTGCGRCKEEGEPNPEHAFVPFGKQAESVVLSLPDDVDTLREEHPCPVCGNEFDGEYCEACGYEKPPAGLDDPDTEPRGEAAQRYDEVMEDHGTLPEGGMSVDDYADHQETEEDIAEAEADAEDSADKAQDLKEDLKDVVGPGEGGGSPGSPGGDIAQPPPRPDQPQPKRRPAPTPQDEETKVRTTPDATEPVDGFGFPQEPKRPKPKSRPRRKPAPAAPGNPETPRRSRPGPGRGRGRAPMAPVRRTHKETRVADSTDIENVGPGDTGAYGYVGIDASGWPIFLWDTVRFDGKTWRVEKVDDKEMFVNREDAEQKTVESVGTDNVEKVPSRMAAGMSDNAVTPSTSLQPLSDGTANSPQSTEPQVVVVPGQPGPLGTYPSYQEAFQSAPAGASILPLSQAEQQYPDMFRTTTMPAQFASLPAWERGKITAAKLEPGAAYQVAVDGAYLEKLQFDRGSIQMPQVPLRQGDVITFRGWENHFGDGPQMAKFTTIDGETGWFNPNSWGSPGPGALVPVGGDDYDGVQWVGDEFGGATFEGDGVWAAVYTDGADGWAWNAGLGPMPSDDELADIGYGHDAGSEEEAKAAAAAEAAKLKRTGKNVGKSTRSTTRNVRDSRPRRSDSMAQDPQNAGRLSATAQRNKDMFDTLVEGVKVHATAVKSSPDKVVEALSVALAGDNPFAKDDDKDKKDEEKKDDKPDDEKKESARVAARRERIRRRVAQRKLADGDGVPAGLTDPDKTTTVEGTDTPFSVEEAKAPDATTTVEGDPGGGITPEVLTTDTSTTTLPVASKQAGEQELLNAADTPTTVNDGGQPASAVTTETTTVITPSQDTTGPDDTTTVLHSSKDVKARIFDIFSFVEEREQIGLSQRNERMAQISRFEGMTDEQLAGYIEATREFAQVAQRQASRRVTVAGRARGDDPRLGGRVPDLGRLASTVAGDDDPLDDSLALL